MFYVYILKSRKTENLYIGITGDLEKRIKEHNSGFTISTKPFIPWGLVYCEGYSYSQDAKDREEKLKQFGRVYSQLKRRIYRSIHLD